MNDKQIATSEEDLALLLSGNLAIEGDGTKFYYDDDRQLHKVGAPAITWSDGSEGWYQNNRLHRENGPAYVGLDGAQYWYQDGKQHREDGPAVVIPHRKIKEFWINGEQVEPF